MSDANEPAIGKVRRAKIEGGVETLETEMVEGKTRTELLATLVLNTVERNTIVSRGFANQVVTTGKDVPDFGESTRIVAKMCGQVRAGSLSDLTDMLTAQALTLDAMFTTYSQRALANLHQYPEATERYTNLAAKAQAQCRTTVETLARVKRGGKQVVKVVHVHEGGQAVVADTVNNGGSGGGKLGNSGQPHEQGPQSAALPCPDPTGNGVPIPGNARKEPMPVARREGDGRA